MLSRDMQYDGDEDDGFSNLINSPINLVRRGIEEAIIQQNRGKKLEISDTLIFSAVLTTLLSGTDEYVAELLQIFSSCIRNADQATVTSKFSVACHFFSKFMESSSDPKLTYLAVECSELLLSSVPNDIWQSDDFAKLLSSILSLLTASQQKAILKKQISLVLKNLLQTTNMKGLTGPFQLIGDSMNEAMTICSSASDGLELIKILKSFFHLLPSDVISSITNSLLQFLVPLDLVVDVVRLFDFLLQEVVYMKCDAATCKQIIIWLLDHAYSFDLKVQSVIVVTLSSAVTYLKAVCKSTNDLAEILENVTAVLFQNSNDYDTLSAAKRIISVFLDSNYDLLLEKLVSLLSYKNISTNNVGFTCNLIEFATQSSENARSDKRILQKLIEVLETARDLNLSLKSLSSIQKTLANIVAAVGVEDFLTSYFPRNEDESAKGEYASYPDYMGEVIHKSLLIESSAPRSLIFYQLNFSHKSFDYFQSYCKNVSDFDASFGKFCPFVINCLKARLTDADSPSADRITSGLIELLSRNLESRESVPKSVANTLIRLINSLIEVFPLAVDKHLTFNLHCLIRTCVSFSFGQQQQIKDHLSSILDQLIESATVDPNSSNQQISKDLSMIIDFCESRYVISSDQQEAIKSKIVNPIVSSHRINLYSSICNVMSYLPLVEDSELKDIICQTISFSPDKFGVVQLLSKHLDHLDDEFLLTSVFLEMIRSVKSSDRKCRETVGNFFLALATKLSLGCILDQVLKCMTDPEHLPNCVFVFVKLLSSEFPYKEVKAELDRLFPELENIYNKTDPVIISEQWNDIIVVLIRFLNVEEMQSVLPVVGRWLFGMLDSSRNTNAVRPKLGMLIQVKNTIRKLIRKYTLEVVLSVTPENHVPLVMYIQKHDRKELRLKEQGRGDSSGQMRQDDDDDGEEEEEEENYVDKRKRREDDEPDDKIEWSNDGILQISAETSQTHERAENKKQRTNAMNIDNKYVDSSNAGEVNKYGNMQFNNQQTQFNNRRKQIPDESKEPRKVAVIGLNPRLAKSKRQTTRRHTRKDALENFSQFVRGGKQFVKRNLS